MKLNLAMSKFRRTPYLWWYSLCLYLLVVLMLDVGNLKFAWAELLYDWSGGEWRLREHWLTRDILHTGVRAINNVAVFGLLVTVLASRRLQVPRVTRVRLVRLLLSVVGCFIVINSLKALTQQPCPWDLMVFGGTQPYLPLWQSFNVATVSGRCFPAGHASIGFAWLALFFFWRDTKPRRAKYALCGALTCGFLLGFVQQLRGAHFLLDDFTTAFVCWSIAFWFFYFPAQKESADAS